MTINDLTPEQQLKEIYDQMKGFRVTNAHRKKCTKKAIEQVLEHLYQMWHNHSLDMRQNEKWEDSKECKYWSQVSKLAEEL